MTVVRRLTEAYGADADKWRWGDAHQARFPHPLFDRIPVLRDLVHSPIATDGDNFTLNRGTFDPSPDGVTFPHIHGPSLRVIFDFSDLDRSRFIIAGGQSGNPLSSHFGDLVERWRDGQYLFIVGGGDQVLTLTPATAETN
jgi:penicillin amidase